MLVFRSHTTSHKKHDVIQFYNKKITQTHIHILRWDTDILIKLVCSANGLHGTSHNCQTYIILHTLSSIEGERTQSAENKRNIRERKKRNISI